MLHRSTAHRGDAAGRHHRYVRSAAARLGRVLSPRLLRKGGLSAAVTAALATAALLAATSIWTASATSAGTLPPPDTPSAQSVAGVPTVGPLFPNGLDNPHTCTASVVDSPGHDLILTAAHCVSGTAAGTQFAPGYDDGQTPYGVWTVTHAYVDPAWIATQDPEHDYAFLQVADQQRNGRQVGVQDVTGGNLLGLQPPPGEQLTDVAYNGGLDDQPISCTVPSHRSAGYPAFDCHGYVGGSSGSPWLVRPEGSSTALVDGVIGGLHQGGCAEYTSYSAPFGVDAFKLWLRAAFGIHPDTVPAAGDDGC